MSISTKLIGITGNIATGKSVVRRMLANCGALGIDADHLAHRTMYKDGPAYQPVIDAFGGHILDERNQIDRGILAQIVFKSTEQLAMLESLVHPAVIHSTQARIEQSVQQLAAVEAVKLFEAGMDRICSSVWISHAPEKIQMERLLHTRKMTEMDARARIAHQPIGATQMAQADVVINTEGDFKSTWDQVIRALNDTIQSEMEPPVLLQPGWQVPFAGTLAPAALTHFWMDHSGESLDALYQHLGLSMVTPILHDGVPVALALWDNWNFTATLRQVITADDTRILQGLLFQAIEAHAASQQSEIVLVSTRMAQENHLDMTGFQQADLEQLIYPAWQQACGKISPNGSCPPWIKVLAQPFEQQLTASNG